MNKYEMTEETMSYCGHTLHLIRALIDILDDDGEVEIRAGELGGWIESEKNLDQDGRCWVWGDAWVCGNAQVGGDAQVSGNARVYGNAWVSGNAQVSGNARVGGDAWVSGDAVILQNDHYLTVGLIGSRGDTTTLTRNAAGVIYVKCGCFYGSLGKFREKVKETHGDSKHAKVYLMAADLAELYIDTTPIEEAYL